MTLQNINTENTTNFSSLIAASMKLSDEEEKVTTIALDEYLEGKISWKKTEESVDHKS